MDQTSIHKARLLTEVVCRSIDYYMAAAKAAQNLQVTHAQVNGAEDRLAVALESLIDSGVME
jgi:hypothetical protein